MKIKLPTLEQYRNRSTTLMLINGLLFMGAFVGLLVQPDSFTTFLFFATWVVFLIDYLIQLALAPVKWKWFTRNILTLASLFVPPLRVFLLIAVANRAFRSQDSNLRGQVGLAATYVIAIVIVFGSLFVLMFEAGQPGADIETYGEALWWSVVSITTVGYGDYAPVTVMGRVIGGIVFATGIGLIAVVSATVVGYFTESSQAASEDKQQTAQDDANTQNQANADQILAKLEQLSSRLHALEKSQPTADDTQPSSEDPEG